MMHIAGNHVFRPRFDAWQMMDGWCSFFSLYASHGMNPTLRLWLALGMAGITFVEFFFLVPRSGTAMHGCFGGFFIFPRGSLEALE